MKRTRVSFSKNNEVEQTGAIFTLVDDAFQYLSTFLPPHALGLLAGSCKHFASLLMDNEKGCLYVPASWRNVLWNRVATALEGYRVLAAPIVRHFLLHERKVHLLNNIDGAHKEINLRVECKHDELTISVGPKCDFVYILSQTSFRSLCECCRRRVLVPLTGRWSAFFVSGPSFADIQALQACVRFLHQASLEKSKVARAVSPNLRHEAFTLKKERAYLRRVLVDEARTMKSFSLQLYYRLEDFTKSAETFARAGRRCEEVEKHLATVEQQIERTKENIKKEKK